MEVVKNEYLNNLHDVSSDIERMHMMDPEFWYQQHNLDSDAHHLNNQTIDMIQKYIRGYTTRMETYIELGAMVYEYKICKGILARSKLIMDAIRSIHADYYDFPDDTRYKASVNSLKKIKLMEGEVTIDDSGQSLQTISPISSSEGIRESNSAKPTTAHDADSDTDSDLARPPDGNHPSARHATPGMLLLSATHRNAAGHVMAHLGSCDSG